MGIKRCSDGNHCQETEDTDVHDKKRKFILADWKNPQEVISLLIEELELRGAKVYVCPDLKGSDTYGYVISDEPLTHDETCYFEKG